MNKEKLKKTFPHLYKMWHTYRVNQNKKNEIIKKESYDKYGYEILKELFEMVVNKQYDVACYYGTLLGLIRDNQLIPWDDDLDFIILDTEKFSWISFERDMKKTGFYKYRTIENNGRIVGQSYKKKGVLCDFSLKRKGSGMEEGLYGCYQIPGKHYENGKTALHQYWKCTVPSINGLVEKKVHNITVKIPQNYEEIIVAYYGEGWKTPDPNFIPERESVELPVKITYHKK